MATKSELLKAKYGDKIVIAGKTYILQEEPCTECYFFLRDGGCKMQKPPCYNLPMKSFKTRTR